MAQDPNHTRYYTEWQPTKNLEEVVTGRKILKSIGLLPLQLKLLADKHQIHLAYYYPVVILQLNLISPGTGKQIKQSPAGLLMHHCYIKGSFQAFN